MLALRFHADGLLVVLVTLAILAAVLLPALAGTQPRSKAYQCVNNMRQLALAWTLYASEHNENLPLNFDPRSNPQVPGYIFNGSPSWITGVLDLTSQTQNTNTAYLVDDRYSLLGELLGPQLRSLRLSSGSLLREFY